MDKIDLMKMFLHMGSMTNQTEKQELTHQERIVFATEGIIKPDYWDELPFEERRERMKQLIKQI